jgi:hypothetical protein
VDIGGRSGWLTAEHSRVEEADGPGDDAARAERLAHEPADPEVAQQRSAVAGEEDVGGSHVAVDQRPRVHGRQRTSQRHRDRDNLARTQPSAGEQAGQAASSGVVEHQYQLVGSAHHGAQPNDVGMVDARKRSRLAAQPVARREIARRAQPLERHRLTAQRLPGQPHLAARAEAEQLDHVVAGHLPPRRGRSDGAFGHRTSVLQRARPAA